MSAFTVLHASAYFGQLDIIKWYQDELKFNNINPEDMYGNTPFTWAIDQEKQNVVDYFIKLGYSQNATGKIRINKTVKTVHKGCAGLLD